MHKSILLRLGVVLAVLSLASGPAFAEPKFTKVPTVSLLCEPARVQVDFAVSEPTDVEAAAIDLAGNIVRSLAAEEISFVRGRLLSAAESLSLCKARPALLADITAGPGDRKKGTGWASAETLANIGDPDAVAPPIELLEVSKARDLALFALSRMFDGAVSTASEYRLLPDAQRRLAPVSIHNLPAPEEIWKSWDTFWKANKAKFAWDAKKHPFRKE